MKKSELRALIQECLVEEAKLVEESTSIFFDGDAGEKEINDNEWLVGDVFGDVLDADGTHWTYNEGDTEILVKVIEKLLKK
jgi:hypothetical protein